MKRILLQTLISEKEHRIQLFVFFTMLLSLSQIEKTWGTETYKIQFDTVFKKASLPFNAVRLVDYRQFKTCKTALIGKNAVCYPPAFAVDSMLSGLAAAFMASAATKEEGELIIALYDLNITGRRTDYGFVGNLYVNADFYLGSKNRYHALLTLDSLYQFPLENMPEKIISKYCSIALSDVLFSLPATPGDTYGTYTLGDIALVKKAINRKYKVYVEKPKKGVYRSLEAFLSNSPEDTTFVQIHTNDFGYIKDNFYEREIGGGKKGHDLSDKCYAIFNGEKWFKPYGDTFKEMKVKGGDFYYYGNGLGPEGGIAHTPVSFTDAATKLVYDHFRSPQKLRKSSYVFKLNPTQRRGIATERVK